LKSTQVYQRKIDPNGIDPAKRKEERGERAKCEPRNNRLREPPADRDGKPSIQKQIKKPPRASPVSGPFPKLEAANQLSSPPNRYVAQWVSGSADSPLLGKEYRGDHDYYQE
jgi:hypothetical protein